MTDVRIIDAQASIWATEFTLQSLLASSKYNNEVLFKLAKSMVSKEDAEELESKRTINDNNNAGQITAQIKESGEQSDFETRFAAKRYETAVAGLKDSLVSSLGDIGANLSSADPGSIFRSISGNLDSVNRQFEGSNTALTKLIATFAFVAKVVSVSYERISQLNDGYVQAYSSGVKFADGLDGLNQLVGESGLTMQDYIAIMNKSSQSFNVLGSVRIRNLTNEFRTLTANGSNLTMTLAQSQEGLMAYTDILRMSGRLQRMTDKDIANGAATYLQSINDLSYASGRSREELMASTKDALSRPEFQAFMTTLSDGAKANLETSMTSLAAFGAETQAKFSSFLTAGMAGGEAAMIRNNESLFKLAQATGQLPQLMRIVEMAEAGQDISGAMVEFTEGMRNSSFVQSQNLSILAQHNPLYRSMQEELGGLIKETQNVSQAQEQLAESARAAGYGDDVERYKKDMSAQADATLKAQSEMQEAMTLMNSAFNKLVLDVIYPVLIPTLEWLATKIQTVVQTITGWQDSLANFFGGGEGGETAAGATMLGAAALPFAGYGIYKGIRAFRNRGVPGTPNVDLVDMLQGPNAPDMGKTSRLGRMMSGLGEGVGGLGRGAGSGIQGAMTGIAEGFKAFANPRVAAGMLVISGGLAATGFALSQFADVEWDDMAKAGVAIGALALPIMFASNVISKIPPTVVVGSGYLAAAIAVLGAGIAGAAWLVGSTLPTLSEGLSGFGEIDGNNLIQVGLGVSALGVGLGVLAAGQLLNQLVDLTGWLTSWATEDPVEKLKRFGELGEPLGKAGPALDAFGTAFLNATAKLNAATINDNIDTSIEQLIAVLEMSNDLGELSGGLFEEGLIDRLKRFGELEEPLRSGGLAIDSFSSAFLNATAKLNAVTLNDNVKTSIEQILEVLEMSNNIGELTGGLFDDALVTKLKQFGELEESLGTAGPALDAFGTAFLNATAKLNAIVLNDTVKTSIEQIMEILEMDASGMFGGEPPIIGQINSLADAMAKLNKESNNLTGVNTTETPVQSPDMLSPSDLQKRTLAFYDNQRTSNANIIELLRSANEKLDTINNSVVDDTSKTVSAIKKSSGNL